MVLLEADLWGQAPLLYRNGLDAQGRGETEPRGGPFAPPQEEAGKRETGM